MLPTMPRRVGLALLCAITLVDVQLFSHRFHQPTGKLGEYLRRSADRSCAELDRCVRGNSVERAPNKARSLTNSMRASILPRRLRVRGTEQLSNLVFVPFAQGASIE